MPHELSDKLQENCIGNTEHITARLKKWNNFGDGDASTTSLHFSCVNAKKRSKTRCIVNTQD